MSRVYSDTVLPEDSGVSQDLTLGTTGDTVQVTSGASLNVNTIKDAGGNTIFTSDGSGNVSSVNAGMAGAPALITTNTFTNQASSSFTSGIDSTYKVYIFKAININPATDGAFFSFQANASGQTGFNETITTTFFSAQHSEAGTDGSISYHTAYDQGQGTAYQYLTRMTGSDADQCCAGELYLFNPSGTTYVKQFYAVFNNNYHGDYSMNVYTAGYFNITAAITQLDFKMSSGNMDGDIKMYGL